jgi:predicted metalloprotease
MGIDGKRRGFELVLCGALACSIVVSARGETARAQSAMNCPGASLNGCFTSSSQMSRYLDMLKPLLTDFFVISYGAGFPKPEIRYVKALETGPTGCADEKGGPGGFDQDSYFYCVPDSRIYVGEKMMWQLYTEAGPIAPALGLAHEWGHHLQKERHVQASSQVTIENQADCVAGAWLRYENSKGLFKDGRDDATVSAMSIMIADVERRSHGTDLERLLAFSKGDTQGLADGCDQFSPGTPISPP